MVHRISNVKMKTSNTRFLLRMICKASTQPIRSQLKRTRKLNLQRSSNVVILAKETDTERRRSLLTLKSNWLKNGLKLHSKKLRVNLTGDLLDVDIQHANIARIKLLHNLLCKGEQDSSPHAILIENHVRAVASAYSLAERQDLNLSYSQSLRRISDPVEDTEGSKRRIPYLQTCTHFYLSPFSQPDRLTVKRLPSLLFEKSIMCCLCVLSLTRLNLEDKSFPQVAPEDVTGLLTVIDFGYNRLTCLPSMFAESWEVTELRLNDNRIVNIDIGVYVNLKRLDLSRNPMQGKPKGLEGCRKLTKVLLDKTGEQTLWEKAPARPELFLLDLSKDGMEMKKDVQIVAMKVEELVCCETNMLQFDNAKKASLVLLRMSNLWQFWVYSGRDLPFIKKVDVDEKLHYLGLKPYDNSHDPPVFIPVVHEWLLKSFDIVNCKLCNNGSLCKFIIIPKLVSK